VTAFEAQSAKHGTRESVFRGFMLMIHKYKENHMKVCSGNAF
jgi:hypothetical protein